MVAPTMQSTVPMINGRSALRGAASLGTWLVLAAASSCTCGRTGTSTEQGANGDDPSVTATVSSPATTAVAADSDDASRRDESSLKLESGPCTSDAECVLTDVANACDECHLRRLYPTLRKSVDQRNARCGDSGASSSDDDASARCPRHDTHTGAFYRPQCRESRCIAWRYHGGG